MKKVTRTLDTTVVNYVTIVKDENGNPEVVNHPTVSFEGKLNEKKAKKELSKVVDFECLVTDVNVVSQAYEMDLDFFLENATVKAEQ